MGHRMVAWSQTAVGDEYAGEGHVHTWSEPSMRVRSRRRERNVTLGPLPGLPANAGATTGSFRRSSSSPNLKRLGRQHLRDDSALPSSDPSSPTQDSSGVTNLW